MANKFSDYTKNYSQQNKCEEKSSKESIEELYNRYSKYDNQSLLDEFLKLSIERKRKGELTDEYFQNLKNTLSPYLTDEQKDYYDNLVDKIK